MLKNIFFTVLVSIFSVFLIISFSISVPIAVRPFYYLHIEKYNLAEATGKSEQQIKEAYDEVLDFLTMPNKEFSSGDFSYSDEGKSHFEDCKTLFTLNFSILIISAIGVLTVFFLKFKKKIKLLNPFGYNVSFTIGCITLLIFTIIGGLAALDFDKAFIIFHNIFFYGKDNWLFDSLYDEIIIALPQEFFLNCGILIVASIFLISTALIAYALIKGKEKN